MQGRCTERLNLNAFYWAVWSKHKLTLSSTFVCVLNPWHSHFPQIHFTFCSNKQSGSASLLPLYYHLFIIVLGLWFIPFCFVFKYSALVHPGSFCFRFQCCSTPVFDCRSLHLSFIYLFLTIVKAKCDIGTKQNTLYLCRWLENLYFFSCHPASLSK